MSKIGKTPIILPSGVTVKVENNKVIIQGAKSKKEVVIDEVVGQMLTIILVSFSVVLTYHSTLQLHFDAKTIDIILLGVVPFILFRLFDIVKPLIRIFI